MEMYVKKSNTSLRESYIISKSNNPAFNEWVCIEINFIKNEFSIKKIDVLNIEKDEWELKPRSVFPSSLFNKFLRTLE